MINYAEVLVDLAVLVEKDPRKILTDKDHARETNKSFYAELR